MFGFLQLGPKVSPRWLNAELSGGQARPNLAERKRELRAILRETREKLKQDALIEHQLWGAAHLCQLSDFLCKTVPAKESQTRWPCAAYWPIGSELNLLPAQLSSADSSGRLHPWWLPKIASQSQLEWFLLQPEVMNWSTDKWGLPQPPGEIGLFTFDALQPAPKIVLTPCLAADRSGVRLGYGGGFYDRFLANFREQCLLIACVPEPLFFDSEALPREPHDQCVDVIITESSVWIVDTEQFNRKIKSLI